MDRGRKTGHCKMKTYENCCDSFYQRALASFKMPACTDQVGIYTHGHLQRHNDGRFDEVKSLAYETDLVTKSKAVLVYYNNVVCLAVIEKFFRVSVHRGFSCVLYSTR